MAELDLNVNVQTKGTNKLKGIGDTLAGVGKVALFGVAAAGTAAVAVGAAFTGMASEAEKAQAKLDSVFKSSGAASFTTIAELNAQAEELAKATQFDDEGVKAAQATLLSFGNITGDAFTQATESSADLAAFMGTDIPDASKILGKALAIPEAAAGKLAKQGIILSEAQQAQIDKFVEVGDVASAQGVILDAVSGKFGTVAEDMQATAGGQMSQALEDLGEAGESIGTLLLPVLATVAQGLAGFAQFVVDKMPVIQAAIEPVISFITGLFSGVGDKVGGLRDIFQTLVDFWTANGPTIMSVAGQVFGAIGNVIATVAPIIINLAKVVLPILATAAGLLFTALDIAFKGIGGAFEVLGNVFETVADIISGVVDGVIGAFKAVYNAFAGFWNSIEISVPSIDIPFVGVVGGFSFGLPDLPMLAKGGIVTKPTLALIGESGPEAVIPLRGSETAGNVNNFEFHIQSPIPDEKGIVDVVTRSQRLQGMLAWD